MFVCSRDCVLRYVIRLSHVSKIKICEFASQVLEEEFPQFAHIKFHTADDHFKAVGQCIAAAALPELK